jgi:nucleotide-binding universal stress UspA family protein
VDGAAGLVRGVTLSQAPCLHREREIVDISGSTTLDRTDSSFALLSVGAEQYYGSKGCKKGTQMYRSLLVPLDGSRFGEHVLPIARAIALRSHATVHLVHVYVPISTEGMPVEDKHQKAIGHQHDHAYLTTIRNQLVSETNLTVVSALLDGPIADVLAAYIATTDTDLVLMTTHGRGAFARFWLGDIADILIRQSAAPILLLRLHDGEPSSADPPTFGHILLPLDGSTLVEGILEPALKFGTLMQSHYTLLHVINPVARAGHMPRGQIVKRDDRAIETALHEAQNQLDYVAQRLQATGAQVHTRIVIAKQPAIAILDAAHQHQVDLIAMATHGRAGLRRLLLGSTATTVLRGADRPVLLWRLQQQEHGRSDQRIGHQLR